MLIKRAADPARGGYSSLEEFILRHGTAMGDQVEGSRIKRGRMGYCYQNAARLAMSGRGYVYCEGYATSIIPVLHAWCLDSRNRVVDPTWENGTDYFGIPITKRYLCRSLVKYKTYGLVENWKNGWPMLRDNPETWKVELIERLVSTT